MAKRKRSPWDARKMNTDRLARGWSMTDLARAAGVSQASVTRFFAGTYQAPKMVKKLAHAMGYAPARYVRGLDKEGAA